MKKTKSVKPDAETLAKLNYTDNPYRKELKALSWWQELVEIYRYVKKVKRRKWLIQQCGDIKTAYQRRNEQDKEWLASLFNDYRWTRKYADNYGAQLPLLLGNSIEAIDKNIAPVIYALNHNGYETFVCCHGHCNKYSNTYAYIGLAHKKEFPSDMLSFLDEHQVAYRIHNFSIYSDKTENNEKFVQTLCLWTKEKYGIDHNSIKRLWAKNH